MRSSRMGSRREINANLQTNPVGGRKKGETTGQTLGKDERAQLHCHSQGCLDATPL